MANSAGSGPDQVSLNATMGRMAFQDPEACVLKPQAGAVPMEPGDMVFELVSNTSLKVWVRGSDGTLRSASLTLA